MNRGLQDPDQWSEAQEESGLGLASGSEAEGSVLRSYEALSQQGVGGVSGKLCLWGWIGLAGAGNLGGLCIVG